MRPTHISLKHLVLHSLPVQLFISSHPEIPSHSAQTMLNQMSGNPILFLDGYPRIPNYLLIRCLFLYDTHLQFSRHGHALLKDNRSVLRRREQLKLELDHMWGHSQASPERAQGDPCEEAAPGWRRQGPQASQANWLLGSGVETDLILLRV